MNRKIVQITAVPWTDCSESGNSYTSHIELFALCNDGTVWFRNAGGGGPWVQIQPIPKGEEQ